VRCLKSDAKLSFYLLNVETKGRKGLANGDFISYNLENCWLHCITTTSTITINVIESYNCISLSDKRWRWCVSWDDRNTPPGYLVMSTNPTLLKTSGTRRTRRCSLNIGAEVIAPFSTQERRSNEGDEEGIDWFDSPWESAVHSKRVEITSTKVCNTLESIV